MRRPQRGFTLVEMGITVAIMALSAAVVIPAMNNISRADLRKAASGLASTIRSCYDNAALEGQTYRLTLVPGSDHVTLEATSAAISFDQAGGAVAAAQEQELSLGSLDLPGSTPDTSSADADKKKAEKEEGPGKNTSPLAGLSGINRLSEQAADTGLQKVGTYAFPNHVHLLDVWTDGMDAVQTDAEVYLYFFPNGYTQDAIIHLKDRDERVFSIRVAPLTGRCSIETGYLEPPK
jgi:prepilin-type N-terminal cleavage/methylation domain-containing protein